MARYTNLADILRGAGLSVVEDNGWRTRGAELADIRAIMLHHTATPTSAYRNSNAPTLGTVRNGRPGLPGPLAQFVLGRDGTWYVIASGLANHAGNGSGWGLPTNNANKYTLAIEAESSGVGSDWTEEQLESYPRGVAALCRAFNLGWHRVLAHKEWAPTRKIDPAGWPGDINGFRVSVREWMNGAGIVPLSNEDVRRIQVAILDELLARQGKQPTSLSTVTTDNSELFLRQREDTAKLDAIKALVQELHTKADVIDTRGQEIQDQLDRIEAKP